MSKPNTSKSTSGRTAAKETPETKEQLHPLTIRVSFATVRQLEAYKVVTRRKYRDLVESALNDYFARLKLPPDQQRIIDAHLGR